ncbi:Tripartite-type tricarboxylate transporter, receptor component TctC [Psychrobacillus psychrotolerans]|uniref:Tripartite-type tricarboxylate transporter, receptor component TctC n=1 Tax=Psychrobacillus psychrotolerans TaxID=126156 RepID=A0A1I5UXM3_9BACI|nr:tripartite tricarboxylate transporter substrate binding protein [Psychrobacillus psychrotolerans]SFP99456.1 Tripartite-type tricarboxylate transporter, receptor component TctC [Psychrobacillus psychrotolerans]
MKKMKWKHLLLATGLLSTILVGCSSNQISEANPEASAENKLDFPTKSLNLIVPFAAGGSTDTVGRGVAEATQKYLGETMIVVNRPGASGTIGVTETSKAQADGHTLGLVTGTTLAMQPLLKELDYTIEDFEFISSVVYNPLLLVVDGKSDINSIQDLISDSKGKTLKVGHPGVGTVNDIAHAALFKTAGIKVSNVPFKANNESIASIMGGHIDIAAVHPMESAEYIQNGQLKVLGIFTPERIDLFPEVPTIAEELDKAGIDFEFKDYDFSAWYYLAVPKDTPDEVVTYLRDNMKKVIEDPGFKKNAETLKMSVRSIVGEEIQTQLNAMKEANQIMIDKFDIGKE